MSTYVRIEVVRQYRQLEVLAWRLVLPVPLYLLFSLTNSGDATSQGLPSDLSSMVVFGVMAIMLSGLLATAPELAQERAGGWLAQLRVTPLPAASTVAAKVIAALAFALPAIILLAVGAAAVKEMDPGLDRWAVLILALWIATAPFAALGATIGLLIGDVVATLSVVGISFAALWVLGGMVTEPADLPGLLETTAAFLPTNAAAELGWAAARGEALGLGAIAVVVAWTAGLGALATLAWRRSGRAA